MAKDFELVISGIQGCMRQNITVVTIYASLGEDALIHSLNEVGDLSYACFIGLF